MNSKTNGATEFDALVKTIRKPICSALRKAGIHRQDMPDFESISANAVCSAVSKGKFDPSKGEVKGFAFGVALQKARRPLKGEFTPLSDKEVVVRGESSAEDMDEIAAERQLMHPYAWRALPPYARIDVMSFIETLDATSRAVLRDILVYGESAEATAKRMATATGEEWSKDRVKRVRAGLRKKWIAFSGK